MAYGRLDVFWPDGKIETFPLSLPNISVGRSSGSTITLDTDTISRYHFSIAHESGQVYIRDMESANGTFVDGGRLQGSDPYPLRGGEEIQIGHLRMIYHTFDDTPTMQVTPMQDDTQLIEKETVEFHIELHLPHIAVTPGSYTSVELTIYNTSGKVVEYAVEADGLPNEWIRINRPRLEVDPNDNQMVLINIKPLRRSDSAPGQYSMTVRVHPQNEPENLLEATMRVTILPFSGFGIALGSQRVLAGEPFRLYLHNQGSGPLPIKLTGRTPDADLDIRLQPPQVNLAPGQRMTVQAEVRPNRRRLFGSEQEHRFDILAQSLDGARFTAPISGFALQKPPLPAWGGFALAGMAAFAAIIALFAVLAVLYSPSPVPAIQAFSVNSGANQVARGQPMSVNWTVADARELVLMVNGEQMHREDITPATVSGSREIETEALFGDVAVSLVARNGDRESSEVETVFIYQPATIETLTVTPQSPFRNVRQRFTASWNTPGAVETTITGMEAVTGSTTPPVVAGSSVEFTGIPRETFQLTLSVTDEVGNTRSRAVNVSPIDPTCQRVNDTTTLYSQPDTASAPVAPTAPTGALVVTGLDPSRQWLQFSLPNNVSAWAQRGAFTCTGFNVDDLIEVRPAGPAGLPTPPLQIAGPTATSAAPTAAPTATATVNTSGG
jgi:hypothetical protein